MSKASNQNSKYARQVIGHRFYLAVNAAMILGALFVIWSFATRHYGQAEEAANPITQEDFDKSLEYLNTDKEQPNG